MRYILKTNLSSHLKGCVIYVLSMQSTFFGYPENTSTFIACGSTYTQSITSQKVGKFKWLWNPELKILYEKLNSNK